MEMGRWVHVCEWAGACEWAGVWTPRHVPSPNLQHLFSVKQLELEQGDLLSCAAMGTLLRERSHVFLNTSSKHLEDRVFCADSCP